MRVSFEKGLYVCRCGFAERSQPLKAGFSFAENIRAWITPRVGVAARLREFADESALNKINQHTLVKTPWTLPIPYSKSQTPMPHQSKVAQFALDRNHSYLHCKPGTGKTPIAAMIINALGPTNSTVYVCPPFLTRDVEYKLEKWLHYRRSIKIFDRDAAGTSRIQIIPDSILDRPQVYTYLCDLKERGGQRENRTLIIDEAHRFNSSDSIRSKMIYGVFWPFFGRIILMSGSAMPNGKPWELYPAISNAAVDTIDSMTAFEYGVEYCAGKETEYGWDFTGRSNIEKLAKKITGTFMIHVSKDVLKLPPVTEEVVMIGDTLPEKVGKLEEAILRKYSPEDLMKKKLSKLGDGEIHLSTYRKELGKCKVESSLQLIIDQLESSDEKVLIIAIHKEVVRACVDGLEGKYRPILIDGDVPTKRRQALAKDFCEKKEHRVCVINVQAGGIGLDLQAASQVFVVESPWVPGDLEQALDRVRRIGQKKPVHIRHLIYRNSIDRPVIETILKKQRAINQLNEG